MSTGVKRKIILDCDPGHDDAIAIMVAAAARESIELAAITTVAGNAEIGKTTVNALKVCEIAGIRGVPVAQGAGQPLVRRRETAPSIHGDSGMDGPLLPEPKQRPDERHAVDLIIGLLLESEGDITLVPTGPLTNIAMAMRREPAIVPKIKEIVLMGGGTFGNWTPAAEFNIYADAEAAKVVFESGVPLTMMGLDVTHQALVTPEIADRFEALGTPAARFVTELIAFFRDAYRDVFGFTDPPVHDVCCIAYCIDPTIFKCRKLHVDIETRGEFSYGMTVIDQTGVTGKEANVNVAFELDFGKFWDLILGAVAKL